MTEQSLRGHPSPRSTPLPSSHGRPQVRRSWLCPPLPPHAAAGSRRLWLPLAPGGGGSGPAVHVRGTERAGDTHTRPHGRGVSREECGWRVPPARPNQRGFASPCCRPGFRVQPGPGPVPGPSARSHTSTYTHRRTHTDTHAHAPAITCRRRPEGEEQPPARPRCPPEEPRVGRAATVPACAPRSAPLWPAQR